MMKYYILYYKNIIRLLILGIIPLSLLAYWNYIIYKYMKSAPEVLRRCSNAHARLGEEKELAKVLIGIVVTFPTTRSFVKLLVRDNPEGDASLVLHLL